MRERLDRVALVLSEHGPITAFEALPRIYGEPVTSLNASWRMTETLTYLTHLELSGRVERVAPDASRPSEPERWQIVEA